MTLRSRRVVYITFIAIFLLITPVIILYTAGYRYNFQKHKIQKTGIFILKSEPTGASVYLNGKLRNEATPARIANLLPGDYAVKIEKENFYPWQKNLPVESRLTTFAENIFLFKKSLPLEVVETGSEFFSLSPNGQKMAYLKKQETGNEIWLLNLKNSQKKLIYRLSDRTSDAVNFEWSGDSQKILLTLVFNKTPQTNSYILLDAQTDQISVYQNLSDFYFSFSGVPSDLVLASRLSEFSLAASPAGPVAIWDKKTKHLTVIKPSSGDVLFETNADRFAWSPDGRKLLYFVDFELWIYDFSAEKQTLVSRYSQEVEKLDWVSENYVVILLNNTIKTIELDERDQRNITDLLTLEQIDNFSVDRTRQKIYFSGVIGNKKGVFELPY